MKTSCVLDGWGSSRFRHSCGNGERGSGKSGSGKTGSLLAVFPSIFEKGGGRRYPWLGALMLALGLWSLAACAQPAAAPPVETTAEPPPVVAPATLSAEMLAAVDEFVSQRAALDEEWGRIRVEFDEWSAGLTACRPSSMHQALNGFAIEFNGVTERARNLTRTRTTGELADMLIAAAEEEEAAYRQLRDRWQPNNVTLFEAVETQRTEAARAHAQAADRAIELRETFEDSPDAETVEEFSLALDKVKDDWQDLHDEYTELREEAESIEVPDVLDGLDELVQQLNAVIDGLDDLPHLAGTENTVDELFSAAKAERKELRIAAKPKTTKTTATISSSGSRASYAGEEEEGDEENDDENSDTGRVEVEETLELPDFAQADASVEESETALKQAARTLRSIADVNVEKSLGELGTFNSEHRPLRDAWDDFHHAYNDWLESEGGCNRADVISELDRFNLRMTTLSRDVRALPQTGFLLPMYTLMVDAATREETAMRTLRYTWQPFTVDAFKGLHEQRIVTDGLRRETAIGLEEMRSRF